ncbi:MAG: response regulator [Thermodesulfobacteriota bacterium]|nr:response regulator [Thermodesulfobacteriota bacterium]
MNRILVIDDDEQIREMLQHMLEQAGYEVAVASDGKEGLRHMNDQIPDLVMTDIVMPEKDGIETILDIRKNFPDTKIIAMSGGGRISQDDYLKMAMGLGAVRTFVKPVSRVKLLEAVNELLTSERKG